MSHLQSFHHKLELEPHLRHQLGVALTVIYHGVNEDGLLGGGVGQEVGVGAGVLVKQLSEYRSGGHAGQAQSQGAR